VLRAATAEDLPILIALARSEAVAPFVAPGTADRLAAAAPAGDELLAIVDDAGAVVGGARLTVRSAHSRITSLTAVMLDPAARGAGLGVRAVRALAAHAFAGGAHRIEAEVYGFNEAAQRTFAAAGFVHEGTRRRAYDRHGRWNDGVLYALLADELR
jgi:RimJ/RimL family protein N-acetyltransferase